MRADTLYARLELERSARQRAELRVQVLDHDVEQLRAHLDQAVAVLADIEGCTPAEALELTRPRPGLIDRITDLIAGGSHG